MAVGRHGTDRTAEAHASATTPVSRCRPSVWPSAGAGGECEPMFETDRPNCGLTRDGQREGDTVSRPSLAHATSSREPV